MAVSADILAEKYAKAFLEVLVEGKQEDKLDKYNQELGDLSTLGHGGVKAFFGNPLFSIEEKAVVLEHAFKQGEVSSATKDFYMAVNQAGHAYLANDIAENFSKALLARREKVRVVVTSAKEMTEELKTNLQGLFTKQLGKDIVLDTNVDPSLLGGMRATVGGVVYDSTITGYLDRLGKQFSTHNAS